MSVFPSSPVSCDSGKTFEDASAAPMQQLALCLGSGWCWRGLGDTGCVCSQMSQPFTSQGWPWLTISRSTASRSSSGCWWIQGAGTVCREGRVTVLGQDSAGEGTVTWGKDNPPRLAYLQWMLCTTSLQTSGCCWDLPKDLVQQALLSILVDWKESGSCGEGAFSSDTGHISRAQCGRLVWGGLKSCQFTCLAPVLRSHPALKKPK